MNHQNPKHPSDAQLALFCENDLGLWERWQVRSHVGQCPQCRHELASFRNSRNELKTMAAEMPAGVNWVRLADEMKGNVRVGLAAGECIEAFERRPRNARHGLGWNAAMVLAGATVVMVVALWVRLPQAELDQVMASLRKIRIDRIGQFIRTPVLSQEAIVLEASSSSIDVKANGGTLSLLHPRSNGLAVTVNMQGSAGARYIDEDTGQVTTNRVYYAQ